MDAQAETAVERGAGSALKARRECGLLQPKARRSDSGCFAKSQ